MIVHKKSNKIHITLENADEMNVMWSRLNVPDPIVQKYSNLYELPVNGNHVDTSIIMYNAFNEAFHPVM